MRRPGNRGGVGFGRVIMSAYVTVTLFRTPHDVFGRNKIEKLIPADSG